MIKSILDTAEEKLSEFEAAVTLAKAGTLEKEPIDGSFDVEHYKAIHKFLFDIFVNILNNNHRLLGGANHTVIKSLG